MKRLRIVGLALLTLFALAAVVASSASALEGLLPTNQTFSILSNKVTFETSKKEKLVCGEAKGEGRAETDSNTHGVATFDFLKCEVAGLLAFSLGEKEPKELKEALVLATVSYLICLINSDSLLFGAFLSLLQAVHTHVKALGILINLTGSVIAHFLTASLQLAHLFVVDFMGKEGKPSAKECKDETGSSKKAELKWEIDPEPAVPVSMITEGLFQFPTAVELMDI